MKWTWKNMYIDKYLEAISKDDINFDINYIGEVRCGDICFDLMAKNEYDIFAELYVGGVDTGYAYAKDGTPYDCVDEVTTRLTVPELRGLTVDEFKALVEKRITPLIENSEPIVRESGKYSLIDKANCELHLW